MNTKLFQEISALPTERRNESTAEIDMASTLEILEKINDEDSRVAAAVRLELPQIAAAVDAIVERLNRGGRLLYVGAGTSGRLGILDASECPPTFGVAPTVVQGVIAGGPAAVFSAQEGAEDNPSKGEQDLRELGLNSSDVVCGIAASGRTPYVRGALNYAKTTGTFSIMVSTNTEGNIRAHNIAADIYICPQVGPEAIAGSTRMKSGTAQKMVLNMLSSASMIRLGKTYGNVMVDLQCSNAKLTERARGIVMNVCSVDYEIAAKTLVQAGGNVKTALVMLLADCDAETASRRLKSANGFVRAALH